MQCSIGPFDVHEELARGGMGLVLRATHRADGVPVAVKVISDAVGRHEHYVDDFRAEVQAAAQLTHPHIVTLFEYGTLTEEHARASEQLVAGSPFLAMELADAGSLSDAVATPTDWPTLRRQLLELLDALAHAHARGVVHRDLKPGNVLLHRGAEREARVKLADFGIAHASDHRVSEEQAQRPELERVAGTVLYMAPEQIQGRWRDYGPWTDLYALGIMTHQLVSGALPFTSEIPAGVLFKHLEEEMPPLWPRLHVPEGLGPWVRRLAEKDPHARFRCAADAAHALRALDERSASVAVAATPWSEGEVTGAAPWGAPRGPVTGAAPWDDAPPATPWGEASTAPWSDTTAPWTDVGPDAARAREVDAAGIAPLPDDWRRADEALGFTLHGAGLGLYFLRTVPMVDRDAARDAVWSALRDTAASKAPRALILRGAAGTGKSRIAEWMCERAHETGAATVLRAVHEAGAGPTHGLPRMIAHHYGAVGLDGDALGDRLRVCLAREGVTDELEADALVALIGAARELASRPKTSVRFGSPTERYLAVEGALARAARERAVIVWLDDAQWGGDSVAMVQHALTALEAPILFLLTAREEALVERERERAMLEGLASHPRAEALRVGALAADDTAALVTQLLGLSGELADRVCRRVRGNPLFAVQLVGDWVQRGVLQLTPRGFALRPGERAELPDDLAAVWRERLARLFAGRPPEERAVLELAAILALAHDQDELHEAAAEIGLSFPVELLDALARAHMIDREDTGWSFVHGMLRETLVREAEQGGRAAAMHRACAAVIARRGGKDTNARCAHHLAEGERAADALAPFLAAARERLDESDYAHALALLARREELMAALALPDTDARWVEGWALRADVHRLEWDFAAARTWAQNARQLATRHGFARARAEAELVLAHVARQEGKPEEALAHARTALELFHRLDDDEGRARAHVAMAILHRQKGAYEGAEGLYARAFALFEMVADERGAANAMLGLAHIARHEGQYATACEKYEAARARCERAGYRAGIANCLMGWADVQRYLGELAPAEAAYRRALTIQESIGSNAALIARLNLGLVMADRERWAEARRAFEAELPALVRDDKRAYLGWLHCVLLPCLAAARDAAAFDAHVADARALTASRALVDEDMAKAAARAADLWGAHDPARADAARALSRDLFTATAGRA